MRVLPMQYSVVEESRPCGSLHEILQILHAKDRSDGCLPVCVCKKTLRAATQPPCMPASTLSSLRGCVLPPAACALSFCEKVTAGL